MGRAETRSGANSAKAPPRYRHSRKVAGQWNPVFRSRRACNLQLKPVMRSIPALGNEPEARADGAGCRRDIRINNPEFILQPDANDGAGRRLWVRASRCAGQLRWRVSNVSNLAGLPSISALSTWVRRLNERQKFQLNALLAVPRDFQRDLTGAVVVRQCQTGRRRPEVPPIGTFWIAKSVQFAGTCGSNRTREFSASTERPIIPRNKRAHNHRRRPDLV